ncbi:amidophosphoribosyltransferase [Virgibacillus pantothenticus]|uniref:Amidophosphoribosyltransferase n=1 Tax=Virgibacillus pantothenticus TaxID=1473 RepID=A0A0L0QKV7_VIRPA|nr:MULTISPECIES: amidophosphoribosyltransferase [Virgibacillus]API91436.1 amidophosphoribosyltransferase [Virgibacillus sp. 6R]KNE19196.1 amidophosphoribosyltransferase [Virgibacillus pantothenticus]MBS7426688.1 amidophosphoribosyltransferase [Virgibacillus sp. 19R1-5]MBU8568412.1 amidophosphoribosyltransferase [Virgibacillus pantothenticus]MBU8602404.1 amidophosphoribosyltransferase [Virgibacillus pantothenticus]
MHAEDKGINEECGVFGIWGHEKAAELTYYGLHSMQHRGQEGAGIVVSDGSQLKAHKGLGLVNDVFKHANFSTLQGDVAIGHVRYSTQGAKTLENVQPLLFHSQKGSMALAHNGNLVNAYALRSDLEEEGSILQTSSDTEVLAHLIKRNGNEVSEETITEALNQVTGAYAYLILTENQMFVALDPHGIRPLSIGRLGDAYVVASETCAFGQIGAVFEREVLPGELIMIDHGGLISTRFAMREQRKMCAMEYVYLSRPDSDVNHVNVHASRKNMGKELAKEAPSNADIVVGVPDSSTSAAIGYAEESGLPYEMGIIKNRYVGRTFIQPSQELREQGVKMKLSPVRSIIEGKRIVMIDDSIVRGTTSKRIVQMLKKAGAKEVHVRIASPAIQHPCYYGIDMSTREELIAANYELEEISNLIGADSLAYLSEAGMEKAILIDKTIHQGICTACMTGKYPLPVDGPKKPFYPACEVL